MKTIRKFTLALTTTFLICGVAAAQAGPTAFLKAKDKKLSGLLGNAEKNQQKIVKVVGKMLDFDTLCKDSLGKHWEGRTEDERKEFTDTLRALIEKNLINRLKNTKDRNIDYKAESVNGDKASVVTSVKTGDGPRAEETEIEYRLIKSKGKWTVVDMVTDGISLVSNYRSQFNKIITEEGWAALLKKMKDKLAE
jgi:phospholipid transport system substrate-binding protein